MRTLPITIENSSLPLKELWLASSRMAPATKRLWRARLSHVYGDMKGQRGVDVDEIHRSLKIEPSEDSTLDILISLETYFFLVCNLLAASSLESNPSAFLKSIATFQTSRFRGFLDSLVTGALFDEAGLAGTSHALETAWIVETSSDSLVQTLKDAFAGLASLWDGASLAIPGLDPLQTIHHALFPKNLLHITGQFYTPEWMAELLLRDVDWTPDKRLMDPFCGSGVFLVHALKRGRELGASPNEILPKLLGMDLNPIACAAARANLILYISRVDKSRSCSSNINIISADSLAPAITEGTRREPQQLLWPKVLTVDIDGEPYPLPDFSIQATCSKVSKNLAYYGLRLDEWEAHDSVRETPSTLAKELSARDRRISEQLLPYVIKPADVLLTNPPWVGWEYISRSYRDTLTSAWQLYDLFKLSGLDAAFLKEDISSLALMAAWDLYLKDDGRSGVVLRPATMHSDLAARGVRRLSLSDRGTKLCLNHVRTFNGIKVFAGANTEAATWDVTKGRPTLFPVEVTEWVKSTNRWNPDSAVRLDEITAHVRKVEKHASRTDPQNPESRWLIAEASTMDTFNPLQGKNTYTPRMGVFTGGANAVFYLEMVDGERGEKAGRYRNITERAKRAVAGTEVTIENEVVFSVLRGRDIQMWYAKPEVYLLCPHTRETKMYPLDHSVLKSRYPLANAYLEAMREVLAERQGFAGWEKDVHRKYFYTLQRVGEYTFAPYKVCWKYIASEFTVCVIDGDNYGKAILPNDKVMFIAFDAPEPAYFLGGILSSTIIRDYVNASAIKRQISTNIIKSLALPDFNPSNERHGRVAELCRKGHQATAQNDAKAIRELRRDLDEQVRVLFSGEEAQT